jgi:macrolide transport system ATP-binding/permease protein
MSHTEAMFHDVRFAYDAAPKDLFVGLELHFPSGWTGIVGANGAGKTTILRLVAGQLAPRSGGISAPPRALYCAQRTDSPPELLAALIEAEDKAALKLRSRLKIESDWLVRWDTLSHGERKRAQICSALWWGPELLAIDEPTNHIDGEARRLLARSLRSFRGVGLLVSHDRELLDELCHQCLFVAPPGAQMRAGSYTSASAQQVADEDNLRRQRDEATQELSRLGSRPERLLDSAEPSPGEIRKILLATGIARAPHLIVMDEPTNHLDLPSVECLEAALADCPCALLLVSHDLSFLHRLTERRWDLVPDEPGLRIDLRVSPNWGAELGT